MTNVSFLGILSQRWRILFRMMIAEQSKAVSIVKALCVLHNYLRTVQDPSYTPPGFIDVPTDNGVVQEGFWRTGPSNLTSTRVASRGVHRDGVSTRQLFSTYFNGNGAVHWQFDVINRR